MFQRPTWPLCRKLIAHASPLLIAQLASMSTVITDTVIAARFDTIELAAVGIGSGLYISLTLALAGVIQGLTPIAAQHVGAQRHTALAACFQQGIWLALLLGIIGVISLYSPAWLLRSQNISPQIADHTTQYLSWLAFAMPANLLYRTCGCMLNATSRPRMLMFFGLSNALCHALLAPALAFGWLGHDALGARGCALSNILINLLLASAALLYLARSRATRALQLFAHWQKPSWSRLREILQVGLPIGMSSFVEITSFTLIALLVAPLGATAVAAHRILGNFGGSCYMLPLSLSIATLAHTGQAAGAKNWRLVRETINAGLLIGVASAALLALLLLAFGPSLSRLATPDLNVQNSAIALIWLIAFYQLFDAVQTVIAQALRGLKLTFWPMVIHTLCFWGIGLLGGWWLCYHGLATLQIAPMGLAGFWWAASIATVCASGLFWGLLQYNLRYLIAPAEPTASVLSK